MLSLGIVKEKVLNETRVSLIPNDVLKLISLGFNVFFEENAGILSGFNNLDYISCGAIQENSELIWKKNIILSLNFPNKDQLILINDKTLLICLYLITLNEIEISILFKKKITLIFLDQIPRTSKAQSFDVLSSISNVSGYRAVVESLYEYRNFFSGQISFLGKLNPVKFLIIGGGVIGLSAINIARDLGADVYLYDSRFEVQEQAKSLGANFINLYSYKNNLEEYLLKNISKFNIIITFVINKDGIAQKLISKKLIKLMFNNSIIVDLAIKYGGNCELSVLDKITYYKNNIKIISYYDFSRLMPNLTSKLYSAHLFNIINYIYNKDKMSMLINLNDFILNKIVKIYEGKKNILKIKYMEKLDKDLEKFVSLKEEKINVNIKNNLNTKKVFSCKKEFLFLFFMFLFSSFYKQYSMKFLHHLMMMILSCNLGYFVITKVKHVLHTPLMSITNVISGIISVGALLQINKENNYLGNFFAFISLLLVSINIFTGFFVTKRMLKMFYKKDK